MPWRFDMAGRVEVVVAIVLTVFAGSVNCGQEKSLPIKIKISNKSPHGPVLGGELKIVIAGGESRAPLERSVRLDAADGAVIKIPGYYTGMPGGLYLNSPNYHLDGSPNFVYPPDGVLVVQVGEGPPACDVTGIALGPSRQRLAGVRLRILPEGEEAITDANGAYRIVMHRACGGMAEVVATRDGHEEKALISIWPETELRLWRSIR